MARDENDEGITDAQWREVVMREWERKEAGHREGVRRAVVVLLDAVEHGTPVSREVLAAARALGAGCTIPESDALLLEIADLQARHRTSLLSAPARHRPALRQEGSGAKVISLRVVRTPMDGRAHRTPLSSPPSPAPDGREPGPLTH